MIRTKKVNGGTQVKLTFTLPAGPGDGEVAVLGDFSNWDVALPLKPRGATRSASVLVDTGRRYAFRYCGADGSWFNDDQADTEPNGLGDLNSVIDLRA